MSLLSQTAEYALRAVLWLASQPDQPMTVQAIAKGTQVPAGYLSKVLQTLGRAGLVRSQRGLGGGFILTRSPAQLSALEVINAVDPLKRIHECPLKLRQHKKKLCPLHRRLDDAVAEMERSFGEVTIGDLLGEGELTPLGAKRPSSKR